MTTRPKILPAHRKHPRSFREFNFVYPVLSRRAKGISVGINTNPDKACNFDCVYCQVDRTVPAAVEKLDLAEMREELRVMLKMIVDGSLYEFPPFDEVPRELRLLNDVALSGDAEPTTITEFSRVIEIITKELDEMGLDQVKIVLMTDAAGLDKPDVVRGIRLMDRHHGEVWAKLDAGTEAYYRKVNRTSVPFSRILNNIVLTAKERPVVIQSLFMRLHGEPPMDTEIAAFCDRLNEIKEKGGRIKSVQVYTVVRKPAESFVTALSDEELDKIAEQVTQRTGLAIDKFYGK